MCISDGVPAIPPAWYEYICFLQDKIPCHAVYNSSLLSSMKDRQVNAEALIKCRRRISMFDSDEQNDIYNHTSGSKVMPDGKDVEILMYTWGRAALVFCYGQFIDPEDAPDNALPEYVNHGGYEDD